MLNSACLDILLNADGKALATCSEGKAHVVPVSSIRTVDDKIQLVNYFFGLTLSNLELNPHVSLAVWRGLVGYQIQAKAEHFTEGEEFESVKAWIKEILPSRIVKGVVILTPERVRDISADPGRAGQTVD